MGLPRKNRAQVQAPWWSEVEDIEPLHVPKMVEDCLKVGSQHPFCFLDRTYVQVKV